MISILRIDKRYRFYSHGLFKYPDESIEEVSEHNLESMFSSLELKPGQRLLDIGGSWGGVRFTSIDSSAW
jgi:cyclopropane-fatty-acyl-phospholipid synthase